MIYREERCEACRGAGWRFVGWNFQDCPDCDGSGVVHVLVTPCG